MTVQDKVETEGDTQVSEIFTSDLKLFDEIKDKLLFLDRSAYPDYEMVMAWIEHSKEQFYYEDVSLHEVVHIAFLRCFRAYLRSKVGLPKDKFFTAFDKAVRREIDQLGIDFAQPDKAEKDGGRPPRKESSSVVRLG